MYDVIIIGGGPAGLTAAVYAIRKRMNALIISPDLGGKTRFQMYLPENIDRFQVINGAEIVNRFISQIEYLDFTRKLESVNRISIIDGGYDVETEEGNHYQTKAIIVATGTRPIQLKARGESKYRLRGLAYSAISYAPLFIDRTVAVVGEDELGVRSALELAQNARQVYYITSSTTGLDSKLGEKLKHAGNVTILEGFQVAQIKGDETNARSVVVNKGLQEKELVVDVTFIEMGLEPNSECVAGLVDLNKKNQITIDSNSCTSRPGIFAAGDVTDIYAEQVLICISEGAKAALSAYEYILSQ